MLIRDGSIWPMRMLRSHKSLRTLLFMALSGVIVDSLYLNSDSMFWLFKPLKKHRKSTDGRYMNGVNGVMGANGTNGVNGIHNTKSIKVSHVCHHKGSCSSHNSQVRIWTCTVHFCFAIFAPLYGVFECFRYLPLILFSASHWKCWNLYLEILAQY